MKNFPAIIVLLFVFVAVTAFAVSDKKKEENPLPASTSLLDRLTDELQFLVQLSETAQSRMDNEVHADLAGDISDAFQKKNRELCLLIIERSIPAKRALSEAHQKAVVSLMPARESELNARFASLLRAEFDTIQTLINRQKGLIEEREVLDFVEQVLITQDHFRDNIGILQLNSASVSKK